jgi:hypothetical protein
MAHVKPTVTDLIDKFLPAQKRKVNFGLQKLELWEPCIAVSQKLLYFERIF